MSRTTVLPIQSSTPDVLWCLVCCRAGASSVVWVSGFLFFESAHFPPPDAFQATRSNGFDVRRAADHYASKINVLVPHSTPRQEHQVGRLLSIFEECLARRAYQCAHGQAPSRIRDLARAHGHRKAGRDLSRAVAYLSAQSPEFLSRTWDQLIELVPQRYESATAKRWMKFAKSGPLKRLLTLPLYQTEAVHILMENKILKRDFCG